MPLRKTTNDKHKCSKNHGFFSVKLNKHLYSLISKPGNRARQHFSTDERVPAVSRLLPLDLPLVVLQLPEVRGLGLRHGPAEGVDGAGVSVAAGLAGALVSAEEGAVTGDADGAQGADALTGGADQAAL